MKTKITISINQTPVIRLYSIIGKIKVIHQMFAEVKTFLKFCTHLAKRNTISQLNPLAI